MDRKKLSDIILYGIAFIILIALFWLVGKYVLIALLPFIIAMALSSLVEPASKKISEKTRMNRRFVSVFLIVFFIIITAVILFSLGTAMINEGRELVDSVSAAIDGEENAVYSVITYFSELRHRIPIINKISDKSEWMYGTFISGVRSIAENLSAGFAKKTAEAVSKIPGVVFASFTAVISVFYICCDRGGIKKEIAAFLGDDFTEKICRAKRRGTFALHGFLKSYCLIMLVTFAELFFGFTVLKIDYPFFFAFFIALADILPVVGAGLFIVPLAVVNLILGQTVKGIGLIILFVVMSIIRQITEPRILGGMMDIHPLVSLIAVYIGFVFFGFIGMIFMPMLLYLVKSYLSESNQP